MREILFRGKRLDNGEWVKGLLTQTTVIPEDGQAYVATTIDAIVEKPFDGFWTEVDPETVGQYTGLKDKNGNRIFEGDIMYSVYSKKNYPVYFGEYAYTNDYGDEEFACGWYNKEPGYEYKTAVGSPEDWAEVVGNIHDSPELLGGG